MEICLFSKNFKLASSLLVNHKVIETVILKSKCDATDFSISTQDRLLIFDLLNPVEPFEKIAERLSKMGTNNEIWAFHHSSSAKVQKLLYATGFCKIIHPENEPEKALLSFLNTR